MHTPIPAFVMPEAITELNQILQLEVSSLFASITQACDTIAYFVIKSHRCVYTDQ